MSTWMLTRLKKATREQETAADADRLSLLTSPVTRASYVTLLERIYGFEAPIEKAFAMTNRLGDTVDLRSRTHIRLLRSDLAALGVDPSELPVCRNVKPFLSTAEALGWMYVVDRNAQLHGNLYRHLAQWLPQQLLTATSYLSGGGVAAGPRLDDLGEALSGIAQTTEVADEICVAALAAFMRQRTWFQLVARQLAPLRAA